eukprot:192664_1
MCCGCSLNDNVLSYHCEIDIRILTLRCITFFQTTASSSISRFLVVFLNKYLNAQQLGIIAGSRRGVAFFASFLWGFMADWTQRHLLCLITGLVLSTIGINGYLFKFIYSSFWHTLALATVTTVLAKSGCLFDAMVLLILGENQPTKPNANANKDNTKKGTRNYGATRLWGAVGWGFGALICGSLLATFGEEYLIWFYDVTYSIPILIMVVSSSYLTIKKQSNGNNAKKQPEKQNKKDHLNTAQFKRNVCSLHGLIFLGNLLIFGICMAFVENYLFLFLIDYFDSNEFVCGLTIVVMVCGEVPMFHWSEYFLNKIGIIGLLSLAHLAYVLRCVGYTLLPQTPYYAWFILLIEPLHGLTFAGMWIASVEYGSKLAPFTMQGTMQGLISGIYQCLASCVGTIVGGILYHHLGPVFMYRLSALIIAGWMIFFQISLRIIRLCSDSDGIKLMFGEHSNPELKESLNKNVSISEAPQSSLLIHEDASDVFCSTSS